MLSSLCKFVENWLRQDWTYVLNKLFHLLGTDIIISGYCICVLLEVGVVPKAPLNQVSFGKLSSGISRIFAQSHCICSSDIVLLFLRFCRCWRKWPQVRAVSKSRMVFSNATDFGLHPFRCSTTFSISPLGNNVKREVLKRFMRITTSACYNYNTHFNELAANCLPLLSFHILVVLKSRWFQLYYLVQVGFECRTRHDFDALGSKKKVDATSLGRCTLSDGICSSTWIQVLRPGCPVLFPFR